ncbi:hypothetical protein HK099_007845 [Clydaea vesicula]|uniref:Uncharacterized protein n=1 Tax=Clydaea vesicula TaxID=447962 RepID=A0AAD5Y3M5_9FUNG|nr:hypothetical protein HK099_007845 [Clydaea vesicula]KAJ3396669.1 hypothetical protein HDU92_002295 [Lobulomyces angularis]
MGQSFCRESKPAYDGEVELKHFHLLRVVGKGSFGKVRIVRYKKTDKIYALKYIDKNKTIKNRATENTINERRLLEETNSNFVCNLRFAFQDEEYLFMVLDLMMGGDLRFHLERMKTIKEGIVKFYVAEISVGLSYIHDLKIVHRDLKPDNILLDEFGHAHLSDFNIATHFRKGKPLLAIAGSMAYMAPEILSKQGYYSSIDWWSLGVVTFELLFGKRPFRAKTNKELIHAILNTDPIYPPNASNFVSRDGLDFLQKLLTKDVNFRIGTVESGGRETFRSHPWFKDIDWERLEAKKYQPPFVPDTKSSNFDASHDLVELLLDDKPLSHKKSRISKKRKSDIEKGNIDPVSGQDPVLLREKKIMERKYLVFDFTKPKGYQSFLSGNMPIIQDTNNSPSTSQRSAEVPKVTKPKETRKLNIKKKNNDSKVENVKLTELNSMHSSSYTRNSNTQSFHKDIMEGKDFEDLVQILTQFDVAEYETDPSAIDAVVGSPNTIHEIKL